ncbi:hypothetical protein GEMRC1_001090 [Eukaryota sp. GEM-RC1]
MLSKHLNTSYRGKVNNYNCDPTYVTTVDDGSNPSLQSDPSRRLVYVAAAMSLRPTRELFADEYYDDEDDHADRRRTIMDSALGRRGIRSEIPILKSLETNRILSCVDDLAAIAAQDRAEHLVHEVQKIDTQRQRALVQWVGASEPT